MTRQREQFILMMQNWESVQKYADLAADSYGTATEKMEAYTSSVEAAKNSITNAIEGLTEDINGSGIMIDFYNAIGTAISHIKEVGLVLAGIITTFGVIPALIKSITTGASGLTGFVPKIITKLTSLGDSLSSLGGFIKLNSTTVEAGTAAQNAHNSAAQEAAAIELEHAGVVQGEVAAEEASTAATEQDTAEQTAHSAAVGEDTAREETHASAVGTDTTGTETHSVTVQGDAASTTGEISGRTQDTSAAEQEAAARKQQIAATRQQNAANLGTKVSQAITGASGLVNSYLGGQIGSTIGQNLGGESGSVIGSMLGATGGMAVTSLASTGGKAIGKAIGSAIGGLGGPIGAAIGSAVGSLASTGIMYLVNRKTQLHNEEVEAAQESFKTAESNYSQAKENESYADTIDKYKYGVDANGNNVSLTDEEYDEFIKANNKLAETFPDLISHYDEEGNAILNISESLDASTGSFNTFADTISERIEQLQDQADTELLGENILGETLSKKDEGMNDQAEKIRADNEDTKEKDEEEIAELQSYLAALNSNDVNDTLNHYKEVQEAYREKYNYYTSEEGGGLSDVEAKELASRYVQTDYLGGTTLLEYLSKLRFSYGYDTSKFAVESGSVDSEEGFNTYTRRNHSGEEAEVSLTSEDLDAITSGEDIQGEITEKIDALQNEIDTLPSKTESEIQELYNSNLTSYTLAALRQNETYAGMDSEDQAMVQQIINGTKAAALLGAESADEYLEIIKESVENIYSFLNQDGNGGLRTAIENLGTGNTVGEEQEYRDAAKSEFEAKVAYYTSQKESGAISPDQYTDYLTELAGYAGVYNFGINTETGEVTDNKDMLSLIYQAYKDNGTNNFAYGGFAKYINGLSMEEAGKMYEYAQKGYSFDASKNLLVTDTIDKDTMSGAWQYWQQTQNVGTDAYTQNVKDFLLKAKSPKNFDISELAVGEEFSDAPEEVRNKIQDLAESVRSGETSVEDAVEEYNDTVGTLQLNATTNISGLTMDDMFTSDWDANSNKMIDSFSELKAVLDEVADSYQKLKSAQSEQNSLGHLTWQTVLSLLSANQNYIKCLDIGTDSISLSNDAQKKFTLAQMEAAQAEILETIETNNNRAVQIETAISQGKRNKTTAEGTSATESAVSATDSYSTSLLTLGYASLFAAQALAEKNTAMGGATSAEIEQIEANATDYAKKVTDETVISTDFTAGATNPEDYEVAVSESDKQFIKNWTGHSAEEIENGYSIMSDLNDVFYKDSNGNIRINTSKYGSNSNGAAYGALYNDFASYTEKGDVTGWDTAYETPSGSSSKEDWERIQEIIEAINKEYKQMVASNKDFADSSKSVTTNLKEYFDAMDTDYYDLMEKMYQLESNALMKSKYFGMSLTDIQSAGLDDDELTKALNVYKETQEVQMKIANLDDEQVQERIDLLELVYDTNDTIIEEYKNLVKTADTTQERIEYEKKLNDKLKEQIDLIKEIAEWKQSLTEFKLEYESGTPETSTYKALMEEEKSNLQTQLANAKSAAQQYWQAAYDSVIEAGGTTEEATTEANNDENYRNAVTTWTEIYKKIGELIMTQYNDEINAIERRMQEFEYSKPSEWKSTWNAATNTVTQNAVDKIKSYYGTLNSYYQEEADAAYKTLTESAEDLTDEQIEQLTEKYNSAMKEIKENSITELEEIKSYQESVYSALTSEVERYKEQINEQKEIVEDYYDKEIEKLEDKNKAIERTNKLLQLQKALQSATEEKQRVYRQGEQKTPLSNYIG